MSLQIKVIGLILLSFFMYGVLDYGVQRMFILPSFISLEQEESLKNMDRGVQAIQREIQHLGSAAADWAFWDDTYQFAQDRNDAYQESNLNEQALVGLNVNLLCIFDQHQELLWEMAYDLKDGREIKIPSLVEQLSIIELTAADATAEGVLLTTKGPMLISARPILKSDKQGPVKGFFVLGRFLDMAIISEQARIKLSAIVLGGKMKDPETSAILTQLKDHDDTVIIEAGGLNRVYRVLPGMNESSGLLLQVEVPRSISVRGEETVRFALFSLFGVSLVILAVLIVSLRKMVLIPLKQLTDHTVAITQNNDLSARFTLKRKDEIGILSQKFDRMVERLTEAHDSLLETSYASGMAEVATGVLHNVGNVLNSVNVSSTLIMDQLHEFSINDVAKVSDLLVENEKDLGRFITEDSRGRMIPEYMNSLATVLKEERDGMLKEVKLLQDKVGHIKEVIAMQQNYSQLSKVSEILSLEKLLEDTLKLNFDELDRHDITVQRDYQAVAPVAVNRHKATQIILNLINNAKDACHDSSAEKKIITLRIFNSSYDQVCIRVTDNGKGIKQENLTKIFQYGFTTRKSGHGFGLHSSALMAKELGGSLTVKSDGPGCGASFTLELPCQPGGDS